MGSFLSKRWGLLLGVVLAVLVWVLASFTAVIVLLSLIGTYWLIGRYSSPRIISSWLYQLVVSIVAYITILQIMVLCVWVIDHNFPLSSVILVTGIVLAICCLLERFFADERSVSPKLPLVDASDGWAILIAAMIVGLLLIGPVKNAIGKDGRVNAAAVAVDYLNTSLDDSSHLSRINDRLQLNRGVLDATDVEKLVVHQNSLSTYPPGWHSANAAIIKALKPDIKIGGQSLLGYVATKIFWMAVLVYCFARVTFSLFWLFFKRRGGSFVLADHVWLVGALSFFSYYALVEQFKEGFYNFIPLLIGQLLALLFLLQLADDQTELPESGHRYRALVPIALFMTSAVLTWFLVLPGAIAFVVAFLYYASRNTKFKKLFMNLWQQLKPQLFLLLLAVVAMLAQYKILTANSARSFREGVDDPGAITIHSTWYFLVILVGIILLFSLSGKLVRVLRQVTPYAVSLVGYVLFIYLFQMVTIHHPEYYYYKSLNTVVIMALPLAIVGWGMLLKFIARYPGANAVFLSAALVLLLPLVIGIESLNSPNLGYLKGDRAFTDNENRYIYHDMTIRGEVPVRQRTVDTILYLPGDMGHNIIGTNIIRSIQHVDDCDAKIFNDLLFSNEPQLFKDIGSCQTGHLTIVTRPVAFNQVQALVNSHALNQKVIVKEIE